MFNWLIDLIMGKQNKEKKDAVLPQKGLVNKEEKPKYKVYDTVDEDGKIKIIGEQKDSAGAAPKQSLAKHLEEIHGNLCERGLTDKQGNFIVLEIKRGNKWEKFERNEVISTWDKVYPYAKFEGTDHVEISEKEEK